VCVDCTAGECLTRQDDGARIRNYEYQLGNDVMYTKYQGKWHHIPEGVPVTVKLNKTPNLKRGLIFN
jgi:hypothetical protein